VLTKISFSPFATLTASLIGLTLVCYLGGRGANVQQMPHTPLRITATLAKMVKLPEPISDSSELAARRGSIKTLRMRMSKVSTMESVMRPCAKNRSQKPRRFVTTIVLVDLLPMEFDATFDLKMIICTQDCMAMNLLL
jgi:hypothetical protein